MSVAVASRSRSSPTDRLNVRRSLVYEETNEHNGESPKSLPDAGVSQKLGKMKRTGISLGTSNPVALWC